MENNEIMRNLDGIFFRIKRDGKYLSVCLSDMTKEERTNALSSWDRTQLARTVDVLCERLREIGDTFDIIRE